MANIPPMGRRIIGGVKTKTGPEKNIERQLSHAHERMDEMAAQIAELQSLVAALTPKGKKAA